MGEKKEWETTIASPPFLAPEGLGFQSLPKDLTKRLEQEASWGEIQLQPLALTRRRTRCGQEAEKIAVFRSFGEGNNGFFSRQPGEEVGSGKRDGAPVTRGGQQAPAGAECFHQLTHACCQGALEW